MPPKKESGFDRFAGIIEAIKAGVSILPQVLLAPLFDRIHQESDAILDKFEKRALRLQDRMMSKLAIAALFGLGVLALFIAGFFALREYVRLSNAQSFALIGVALLVAGFMLHYRSIKKEGE